ncbi:ABC transporter permease [bacterium]|nr:ABC transporter permease [bacterium]
MTQAKPFFISRLGASAIESLENLGNATIFLLKIMLRSLTPPYRLKLVIDQLYVVGFQSLSVITLVAIFTGAVLAVQGEYTLSKFGATAYTGPAVALSLIRELGPVLTALMVIGRAGSAMTAELGIMKITEQTDALVSMGVDPLRYLIVPRFLACLIAVPLLASIFNVVGILGGYLVATATLDLSSGTFISQMVQAIRDVDVNSGLVKSICFGLCIGWIASYKGYTSGLGAVGVNRATTQSVVTASVTILVLDYFLTSILTQVFM